MRHGFFDRRQKANTSLKVVLLGDTVLGELQRSPRAPFLSLRDNAQFVTLAETPISNSDLELPSNMRSDFVVKLADGRSKAAGYDQKQLF